MAHQKQKVVALDAPTPKRAKKAQLVAEPRASVPSSFIP